MKLKWLMLILLALNLGLLGYLVNMRIAPSGAGLVTTNLVRQASRPSPPRRGRDTVVTVTNDFKWQQLEAEDYRDYITRLRSIGCPETTLRDIIIADLDKLFSPRLRALYPYREDLKYWQPEEEEMANDVNPQSAVREERAIEREKREVMKELLGVDLVSERLKLKGKEEYYQRRLDFLPEEKRLAVRDLLEKYHDLDWRIREKQLAEGVALTDSDRTDLREIKSAREAELNALLAGPERQQLDLWLSDTASGVRHDVYGMNASEQEFLGIYNLRKEFDRQWPRDEVDMNDPASLQRWAEAKAQLDHNIRGQIGEQRFAEYKRGRDSDFHELSATVARYNLPREKAVEVYDYKRAYLDYCDAVGFDSSLTPEQKDEVFRGMYKETLQSIKNALGDRAFNHYHRRTRWLRN